MEKESPRTDFLPLFSLCGFTAVLIYSFICEQGLRCQAVGPFGVERHFRGERNSTEERGGEGI